MTASFLSLQDVQIGIVVVKNLRWHVRVCLLYSQIEFRLFPFHVEVSYRFVQRCLLLGDEINL